MYIIQPFKFTVTKLGEQKYTVAIGGRVLIGVYAFINIPRNYFYTLRDKLYNFVSISLPVTM